MLEWLPHVLARGEYGGNLFAESVDLFESLLWHGVSQDSWNWAKAISRLKDERHQLTRRELAFILESTLEASDTTDKVLQFFVMACIPSQGSCTSCTRGARSCGGADRLPSFKYAIRQPYVDAFVLEVMQWRPIMPLGVPHAVVHDDGYLGYHIPNGAVILANHWSISIDDAV
ncbi:uncharacterized protein N7446_005533 [Penicillium canescens]|uniref:Uncharacterized protein n=1 Tax=Penicillium canescens TaxID=5083 RepID=A0AAD6NBV0_PENCN|nr:uncharacterized protein N7446_005533 [Penicillium canescens]KAJ6050228.1 hypothetical protein N7444_006944 [Penicillium canescens]KAJ6050908.1 hypothetical protein N7460_001442 [Penicillium canescens]KAJ6061413.1 hypothetical protein N7446_005533 [Penicillium canescens]